MDHSDEKIKKFSVNITAKDVLVRKVNDFVVRDNVSTWKSNVEIVLVGPVVIPSNTVSNNSNTQQEVALESKSDRNADDQVSNKANRQQEVVSDSKSETNAEDQDSCSIFSGNILSLTGSKR